MFAHVQPSEVAVSSKHSGTTFWTATYFVRASRYLTKSGESECGLRSACVGLASRSHGRPIRTDVSGH